MRPVYHLSDVRNRWEQRVNDLFSDQGSVTATDAAARRAAALTLAELSGGDRGALRTVLEALGLVPDPPPVEPVVVVRTHCIHGHPVDPDNVYTLATTGRQRCKTCNRNRMQTIRRRRKEGTT